MSEPEVLNRVVALLVGPGRSNQEATERAAIENDVDAITPNVLPEDLWVDVRREFRGHRETCATDQRAAHADKDAGWMMNG